MRRLIAVAIVTGSVTLALMIGQRMNTEAMAVVIGVVFGVAASIPTSLLIVAATRGQRDPSYRSTPSWDGPDPRPPAATPQIIVVSPPVHHNGQATAPWLAPGGSLQQLASAQDPFYAPQTARRFKVVGEDEYWLDDGA